MFDELTAADDLEFLEEINVPTFRIDGMMVAGGCSGAGSRSGCRVGNGGYGDGALACGRIACPKMGEISRPSRLRSRHRGGPPAAGTADRHCSWRGLVIGRDGCRSDRKSVV